MSADRQSGHGHGPLLAETFVDPERPLGTCFRAAGWRTQIAESGQLLEPGAGQPRAPVQVKRPERLQAREVFQGIVG